MKYKKVYSIEKNNVTMSPSLFIRESRIPKLAIEHTEDGSFFNGKLIFLKESDAINAMIKRRHNKK